MFVYLFNLNDGFGEQVCGTMVVFGRGLKEDGLQVLSKLPPCCLRHHSVHVKIAFVANKNQGKGRITEKINKLLIDCLNNLKTLLIVDGVYQNISIYVNCVLCREDAVFILT